MTDRTRRGVLAALAVALIALAGCQMVDRRIIAEPGKNQVVRVQSGDRLYFTLEEDAANGYAWDYVCDDDDVEVTIDHLGPDNAAEGLCGAPGKAKVRIRVHRGYDGPSTVRFYCKRPGEQEATRQFTIGLYRRTDDVSFWK